MNLSLSPSPTKSSEAPILASEVETSTSQNSEFAIVFDDISSDSGKSGKMPDTVDTKKPAMAKTDEWQSSTEEEVEDSPSALREDIPVQEKSHILVPASTSDTAPTSQEGSVQLHHKDEAESPHSEEFDTGPNPSDPNFADGNTPDLRNEQSHTHNEEIKLHDIDAKNISGSETAQARTIHTSETSKERGFNQTNARGENLPQQEARSATDSITTNLSGPRATVEIQLPVGGDRSVEQPTTKQAFPSPMSMLERHLGRHPVTLSSQGEKNQRPNVSIHDMIGLEKTVRQTVDASLTASTPSQTGIAMKSMAPIFVQGAQTAGVKIAITSLEHGEGDKDLFATNIGEEIGRDRNPQVQTPGAVQATSLSKTDVAGSVVQQIANAIRRSPDRPIEIALNPMELGRVRMVLSPSDAGITVNIFADRPDTLDLLRRNIDDLGKSFSEMGYEDISFFFEQGDQTTDESERQRSDAAVFGSEELAVTDSPITPPRQRSTLAIAPDGIDMRL